MSDPRNAVKSALLSLCSLAWVRPPRASKISASHCVLQSEHSF